MDPRDPRKTCPRGDILPWRSVTAAGFAGLFGVKKCSMGRCSRDGSGLEQLLEAWRGSNGAYIRCFSTPCVPLLPCATCWLAVQRLVCALSCALAHVGSMKRALLWFVVHHTVKSPHACLLAHVKCSYGRKHTHSLGDVASSSSSRGPPPLRGPVPRQSHAVTSKSVRPSAFKHSCWVHRAMAPASEHCWDHGTARRVHPCDAPARCVLTCCSAVETADVVASRPTFP